MLRIGTRHLLTPLALALLATLLAAGTPAATRDCASYGNDFYLAGAMGSLDARAVAAHGDQAFVAGGAAGLVLVDIGDPLDPQITASYSYVVNQAEQAWCGDEALVTLDSANQLRSYALPLSDPIPTAHPTTPYYTVNDMAVVGQMAYVAMAPGASSLNGLAVYELDGSEIPDLMDLLITSHPAIAVDVDGIYAYLLTGIPNVDHELVIVDISDPADLIEVATQTLLGQFFDLAVVGDLVYLSDYHHGLETVDVSNPADPQDGDEIELVRYGDRWLVPAGGYLHVIHRLGRVLVLDPAPGATPIVAAKNVTYPVTFTGAAVADGVVLLAGGTDGLQLVRHTPQQNPGTVGWLPTAGAVGAMAIRNDRLYTTVGGDRFQVIDIGDPVVPVVQADLPLPVACDHLVLGADHAFLASAADDIVAVDIGDPDAPTVSSVLSVPEGVGEFAVHGSYLYTDSDDDGVLIVDAGDPAAMQVVGAVVEYSAVVDVGTTDDHLVVATPYGFTVYDLADPLAPTMVGGDGFDMANWTLQMEVTGNRLSIARTEAHMVVSYILSMYDLTDPAYPLSMGYGNRWAPAVDMLPRGDFIYGASSPYGLIVHDITQGATSTLGTVPTTGFGEATTLCGGGGDHIYVGTTEGVLVALRACPDLTAVPVTGDVATADLGLTCWPNPSNPGTTIAFHLERAQSVRLSLFDPAGRRVRTLLDGVAAAGANRVVWTGRDDAGRALPSGIYLYRLETSRASGVGKLMLVR